MNLAEQLIDRLTEVKVRRIIDYRKAWMPIDAMGHKVSITAVSKAVHEYAFKDYSEAERFWKKASAHMLTSDATLDTSTYVGVATVRVELP